MTTTMLFALVGFAFVTSITPGPNNLMLLASGANFGLARTVPHMLGIGLGFTAMVALVGVGLAGAFDAMPMLAPTLKTVSVLYLVLLAWRIATAALPSNDGAGRSAGASGRPMSFLEAAAFQWVNPKAWAMALTAVAAYAPDRSGSAVLLVAAVFGLVNLPSVSVWAVLGRGLRRFLTRPRRLRAFNLAMAALLVASSVPVLLGP